jgi:hypothetical protein
MERPASLPASLFIILIGITIGGGGLYLEGYRLHHRRQSMPVEGTVVRLASAHGNRSAGQSIVPAHFVASAGNGSYYSFRTSSDNCHLGEKLPLLYDAKTGSTLVDSFYELYAFLLIMLVTSVLFLGIGTLSLFLALKRR